MTCSTRENGSIRSHDLRPERGSDADRQTSIGGGGAHDRRRHAHPTVQTNTFLSPALPPLRLWALEKFQTTISG